MILLKLLFYLFKKLGYLLQLCLIRGAVYYHGITNFGLTISFISSAAILLITQCLRFVAFWCFNGRITSWFLVYLVIIMTCLFAVNSLKPHFHLLFWIKYFLVFCAVSFGHLVLIYFDKQITSFLKTLTLLFVALHFYYFSVSNTQIIIWFPGFPY